MKEQNQYIMYRLMNWDKNILLMLCGKSQPSLYR